MKLTELETLLNKHKDNSSLTINLATFINKYKGKINELSLEHIYELIKDTELFTHYYNEENWSGGSKLVVEFQLLIAREFHRDNLQVSEIDPGEAANLLHLINRHKLLDKSLFFLLMKDYDKASILATGFTHLAEAKLDTSENRYELLAMYNTCDKDTLFTFNSALIFLKLDSDIKNRQEAFTLLIKKPQFSSDLQVGFNTLASNNLFNRINAEILLQNPKESPSLAMGLSKLKISNLDTFENMDAILSNAKSASVIANALVPLHHANLLNDTNRKAIIERCKDVFITPNMLRQLADNNILNRKMLDMLLTYTSKDLYSISNWHDKLYEAGLMNDKNLYNLRKYSNIFCNKELIDNAIYLLLPERRSNEHSKHLSLKLTQERFNDMIKICEAEDKESHSPTNKISSIIQFIKQLSPAKSSGAPGISRDSFFNSAKEDAMVDDHKLNEVKPVSFKL